MRGIVSIAGYVPYRRLQRSAVAQLFGSGGGKGTRSVASHDEDTTTMGVEAARLALRSVPAAAPDAIWFATATPAYLDKTNATTIHAALRQPSHVAAFDFGGALRSGVGRPAVQPGRRRARGPPWWCWPTCATACPPRPTRSAGGDGAAAVLVGDDGPGTPVIAEYLGGASVTDEFLDRWRTAGDRRSRVWEERFGETRYVPLGAEAWESALKAAGITADQVDQVAVTGMHGRAVKALARKLGVRRRRAGRRPHRHGGPDRCRPPRTGAGLHGRAGRAGPGAGRGVPGRRGRRAGVPDHGGPGAVVARRAGGRPGRRRPPTSPTASSSSWRGMVTPEPPRRPEPQRVSSYGGLAQRGVEVRLRGLEGPHLRGRPPPARPGSR